jgi:serine/threonine protein kinase
MEISVGETLGQYRIIAKIGQGAMASVFKAYQPSLDRYVALKVLPISFAVDNPIFVERFEREAKSVARLHHPNILPIYDFGVDKDYSYIVMRYVEGAQTLLHVMAHSLSTDRAVELLGQVADALDYAHNHNIVHRDVKPSNILIDGKWALLSDFGLVKMLGTNTRLTETGLSIGTPAYTSPEQAKGLTVDHRTDIYALGVILYEILTGTIPHNDSTPLSILLKRVTQPPLPPRTINPEIPESVDQVLLRALDPDPEARYDRATDLIAALKLAVTDETFREPSVKALSQRTTTVTLPLPKGLTSQEALPEDKRTISLPIPQQASVKRISWPYGWLLAAAAVIALISGVWLVWNRNEASLAATQAQVAPTVSPTLTAPALSVSPTETPILATHTPAPAPVVVTFSVNPATITEGEAITIEWEVTGADQVSIEPIGANLPLAQSLVQWPQKTTFYVLNASNGLAKIDPVFQQVIVKPAPAATTPPLPTPTPPLPTAAPLLETTTATPTLTPDATPTLAPSTARPILTPTPAPSLSEGTFSALRILHPDNLTFGSTDFEWVWHGPKPEDSGFEIRVWRNGEAQLGAHDAMLDNQQGRIKQITENTYRLTIDISQAAGVRGRGGDYLWTVVLIQVSPEYADLGIQAEPALLRFAVSGAGSDSGNDSGGSGGNGGGIE